MACVAVHAKKLGRAATHVLQSSSLACKVRGNSFRVVHTIAHVPA